ncbi:MAG: MBL fold metallo-hydrolase [Clostridia bacterium]|nr:MBL fold metallo-hydrolase [Clostridia bacterium]
MGKQMKLRTFIILIVSAVVALALIITNIFVPVKYLFSYMVTRNSRAPQGVMRVRFVDVGYGDCSIVELPDGKNMLIDAGNGDGTNQTRILKLLNKSGIDNIDYLICTSINGEQCGGLAEILKYKSVGKVYSSYCRNVYATEEYASFISALNSQRITATVIEQGLIVYGEAGYKFTFLSPQSMQTPDGEYAKLNENSSDRTLMNNASAVMWLEYAGTSIVFTSDAGSQTLSKLCDDYIVAPDKFKIEFPECDIITVAGHGGKDHLGRAFYELTSPDTAIISVGKNAYGSPSDSCIADLSAVGCNIKRTDVEKTITLDVTESGYKFI